MKLCVICGKESEKELCQECAEQILAKSTENEVLTAEEQKEMKLFFEKHKQHAIPQSRRI